MSKHKEKLGKHICIGFVLLLASVVSAGAQGTVNTIRVGAFPNITHAQAMVGKANGWFEKAMGDRKSTRLNSSHI